MRIGIANPFAYRPHVGHMAFLHRQFQRLGYRTFFLGCRGGLESCNSRITKVGIANKLECVKCRAGSIRSYLDVEPGRIDLDVPVTAADIDSGRVWSFSTACTALQVEQQSEIDRPDFADVQRRLSVSTARAHVNARRWIRENKLDSVFVFNGRFDMTRAIVEACLAEGVRFVSVERSWFGDGLQLLPQENCLGLKNFSVFCERWAGKPLTRAQALRGSGLISSRVTRTARGEWRQYNLGNAERYRNERIKYLFLPSSQHEWLGDLDRVSGWHHPVQGVEYLFGRLGLSMSDLVVRGHPGWSMKIKNYGANRSNAFYRDWARRVNADYIEPSASIDTHGLMRAAGVVLLNGSSASMEAAWLGKPVVSFVPAAYTSSGISLNLFGRTEVDSLDESTVEFLRNPESHSSDTVSQCRLALRFIYCANFRLIQFVDSMKSINAFEFSMIDPVDLGGLESLALRGILREDDAAFASNNAEENEVITSILRRDGGSIGAEPKRGIPGSFVPLKRRMAYRLIDLLPA